MKFIVKQPKQCTRKELNMFYVLVWQLSLSPSACVIKKICRCYFLGLCLDNWRIAWISAIKRPRIWRRHRITELTNIKLSKTRWEYGYVYVQPKYRWLGISKKLYMLLSQKTNMPLYATVKIDNIPMQKLLKTFWFVRVGKSFSSPTNHDELVLYTNPVKILLFWKKEV